MNLYIIHYRIPRGEMGVLVHVVLAYTKEQALSLSSRRYEVELYDVLYVHEVDMNNKNGRVEATISYITP